MSNHVSSVISLTSVLPTPPVAPTASLPASPVSATTTPSTAVTIRIPSFPPSSSYSSSLYPPLKAHLALLHHLTPSPIISFCARRLLSPDMPHGYSPQDQGEEWVPIHLCDLQTAGVGKDAPKDLRADQSGPGKEIDQKMERMYAAARRSWNLLNTKIPGRGDAL
ncbi:hypothetical protein D1P53_003391 [Cryptococcus gattii VGV]|nr:hypothetical protein D1P53_003391 [Cryptococcus gattii VGV]